MGRALHTKLRAAHDAWRESKDDGALATEIVGLANDFGKQRVGSVAAPRLKREDLELICFEYISG
jgi:hypothetical protein